MAKEIYHYHSTMTAGDTEYATAIPQGAKSIKIQAQTAVVLRLAFVTGKVATPTAPYWTIKANAVYESDDLNLWRTDDVSNIYLASPTLGTVVEIEVTV